MHQHCALIVDPDPDVRRLYALYLSAHGWSVDEADDGRVALAKTLAQRPLVIITELRLPGMSGIDLCKRVRSDDMTVGTIIVVLTGDGQRADQARTSGADEFCAKPCPPDVLLQVLKRLLGRPRPGPAVADQVATPSEPRRKALTRTYIRQWTTTPPMRPPALVCPRCDTPLTYVQSHVGGVSVRRPEQWDYFSCPQGCGEFQYRQTTRALRPSAVSRPPEHAHRFAD